MPLSNWWHCQSGSWPLGAKTAGLLTEEGAGGIVAVVEDVKRTLRVWLALRSQMASRNWQEVRFEWWFGALEFRHKYCPGSCSASASRLDLAIRLQHCFCSGSIGYWIKRFRAFEGLDHPFSSSILVWIWVATLKLQCSKYEQIERPAFAETS